MRSLNLVILFCLVFFKSQAQEVTYYGQYELRNSVKAHTLVDPITKTKFILDSLRITVTAIDSSGKKIWQTDPWKDNKLQA